MNAYEKLRKQVSEELAPHSREIGKGISDICSNFNALGLETAVWLSEKIHSVNHGGITANSYLGYSRIEGRWGLILRTIERDQESGEFIGQRILTLESCSNLEILANALERIGELMRCIHGAIEQQVEAAEKLGARIKALRSLE